MPTSHQQPGHAPAGRHRSEPVDLLEQHTTAAVSRRTVATNSRYTALGQGLSQASQLISSIVLARLLTPHDFGVVAVALLITTYVNLFKDFGMGAALIQRQRLDQLLLNSVFYANLVLGFTTGAMLCLVAGPLAGFLGNPAATNAIRGFGAIVLVTAVGQIHQSLLRRMMRFGAIATISSVSAVVTTVVSVTGAVVGLDYWALVLGTGAGTLTSTTMLWIYDPWRPTAGVSLTRLRSILGVSWHMSLVAFLYLLWTQTDKIVVSRFLGGVALGTYTVGLRVLQPTTVISGVIGEVTLPAFARRQNDDPALVRGFLSSASVIALVIFPVMLGIVAVAGPMVPVVFGSQWHGLIPVIWLIAPAGAIQSVVAATDQLLLAKRRSSWAWRWSAVHVVVLGGLELLGVRWGLPGVAAGYLIGTLILTPLTVRLTLRPIGGSLAGLLRAISPYVWRSTVMALIVLLVVHAAAGAGNLAALVLGVLTGVVVYLGLLALGDAPAARHLFVAVRGRFA